MAVFAESAAQRTTKNLPGTAVRCGLTDLHYDRQNSKTVKPCK